MDKAYITHNLSNDTIVNWLENKEGFKVTIGPPKTQDIDFDLAILEESGDGAREVEVISRKDFNRQQSYYTAGKDLREWSDGPFHLGNKLVMAAWICGNRGADGITFLDVRAENLIDSDYQRRMFRGVMKRLIEEYGYGVQYTNANSPLFSELGASQIDLEPDAAIDPPSVDLPYVSEVFDNEHGDKCEGKGEEVVVWPEDSYVEVIVGTDYYRCVSFIPDESSRPRKYVLMEPQRDEFFRRSMRRGLNRHEIYLLSGEAQLEMSGLKREFGIPNLSPGVRAFLTFGMGTRFKYLKTEGMIETLDRDERRLVRAVSKNENIQHL